MQSVRLKICPVHAFEAVQLVLRAYPGILLLLADPVSKTNNATRLQRKIANLGECIATGIMEASSLAQRSEVSI